VETVVNSGTFGAGGSGTGTGTDDLRLLLLLLLPPTFLANDLRTTIGCARPQYMWLLNPMFLAALTNNNDDPLSALLCICIRTVAAFLAFLLPRRVVEALSPHSLDAI
jgi:hypothetical protein